MHLCVDASVFESKKDTKNLVSFVINILIVNEVTREQQEVFA